MYAFNKANGSLLIQTLLGKYINTSALKIGQCLVFTLHDQERARHTQRSTSQQRRTLTLQRASSSDVSLIITSLSCRTAKEEEKLPSYTQ